MIPPLILVLPRKRRRHDGGRRHVAVGVGVVLNGTRRRHFRVFHASLINKEILREAYGLMFGDSQDLFLSVASDLSGLELLGCAEKGRVVHV